MPGNHESVADRTRLLSALAPLLEDILDADEDRNPETGEAYPSVVEACRAYHEVTGDPRFVRVLQQEVNP
jgi:hypothetical protein